MRSLLAFMLVFYVGATAFAVTPYQRTILRTAAFNVMIKFGAELELSPEVLKLRVVDHQGSLVDVEFNGIEWGPYEYNCKFSYDLSKRVVIEGSEYCK